MPEISKSLTCLYCDKIFNSRATASRHRQKCKVETEQRLKQEKQVEEELKKIETEKAEEARKTLIKQNELFQEQLTQQNDRLTQQNDRIEKLETIVMEQKKENEYLRSMLLELMKGQKPTEPVVTEPIKKKFSIRDYLDNECKNALTVGEMCKRTAEQMNNFDIMDLFTDPDYLCKFVINRAFKDLNKDKLPIRCSSKKLKTFWLKNDDGEWEKGVDIVKIYKERICNLLWNVITNYKKRNPQWIDNEKVQDKINDLNVSLYKASYEEEFHKKAINLLISKTIIDKSS